MVNLKYYLKFAILMALLALTVPATMGCFESPLGSSVTENSGDPNVPGQTDSLADPGQPSDSGDPGTVDTVDPGQLNNPDDLVKAVEVRVLQRNADIINSNPLFNLVNSVLRLVTRLLGGVVSLLDVTLKIPPLALDSNTLISIDIPDINLYVYDFGPDGLQFNKPATMIISYKYADMNGVDESKIRLAWWDEGAGKWSDMPCVVDPVENTVTGPVYHFSSYGLISD